MEDRLKRSSNHPDGGSRRNREGANSTETCSERDANHDLDDSQTWATDRCLNATEVRWLIWEGVKTLDARSRDEHHRDHLAGSVHLGQRPSRQKLQDLGLDCTEPLICWSNGEKRARALAARLGRLGFRSVFVLQAGLDGFLTGQEA